MEYYVITFNPYGKRKVRNEVYSSKAKAEKDLKEIFIGSGGSNPTNARIKKIL